MIHQTVINTNTQRTLRTPVLQENIHMWLISEIIHTVPLEMDFILMQKMAPTRFVFL